MNKGQTNNCVVAVDGVVVVIKVNFRYFTAWFDL